MSEKKEELSKIQSEAKSKMTETPQQPKKKRGRPPKNQTGQSTTQLTTTPQPTSDAPQPGMLGQFTSTFKTLFSFLGKTFAVTLHYPKFELEDHESQLLGEQADGVLVEFAPQVNNKYGKLSIFVVSLLTIFGGRYMNFLKSEVEKEKEKREKENKEKEKNVQSGL